VIFVDSNVILDLVTNDPQWADWSQRQLETAAARDQLAINGVVYSEVSMAFARVEQLDAALDAMALQLLDVPRAALFLAGFVFKQYRGRKGPKASVLPDFFVGAHAAVLDAPLITRDVGRYKTNFPDLVLISP
jgi:hypothetical protein